MAVVSAVRCLLERNETMGIDLRLLVVNDENPVWRVIQAIELGRNYDLYALFDYKFDCIVKQVDTPIMPVVRGFEIPEGVSVMIDDCEEIEDPYGSRLGYFRAFDLLRVVNSLHRVCKGEELEYLRDRLTEWSDNFDENVLVLRRSHVNNARCSYPYSSRGLSNL